MKLELKAKNSQRWYLLGRTSWRFLWYWFCCCFLFVVFLHSHFLFDIILTLPWTIARFLGPFCTSAQLIAEWFTTLSFSTIPLSCYRERYGFECAQVFFTLRSLPKFWHNLLLSRFHWEPALTFLKVAELHTDPRNTDPAHLFVWFTVIHNLLYILTLYLCMSILQKFYLWWKLW